MTDRLLCQWVLVDPDVANNYRCVRCGHVIESRAKPENLYRNCLGSEEAELARNPPQPPRQQELPPMPCRGGKAKKPSLVQQVVSLTTAIRDFVADGLKTVDRPEYEARLTICRSCDKLDGVRCSVCTCFVAVKARGRALHCPIGKW